LNVLGLVAMIFGVEFLGNGGEMMARAFCIFLLTLISLKWTNLTLSDFFFTIA
jgi:hypothetical protein